MTDIKKLILQIRSAQASGSISEKEKENIFKIGNILGLTQYIISLLIITELNRSIDLKKDNVWGVSISSSKSKENIPESKNTKKEEITKTESNPSFASNKKNSPSDTSSSYFFEKNIDSEERKSEGIPLAKYIERQYRGMGLRWSINDEKELILRIWETIDENRDKKLLLNPNDIFIKEDRKKSWFFGGFFVGKTFSVVLKTSPNGVSGDAQFDKIHETLTELLGKKYKKFADKYK